MTTKTFDRETLLDLTVNFVPLFIILFFVGAFLVSAPWGRGGLATVLQYLLLVVPFAALAYLTYISGKAIAGAEKSETVFHQGQALVRGAEPKHEAHDEGTNASGSAGAGDAAEASGSAAADNSAEASGSAAADNSADADETAE